jgi:hypothetical protein
MKKTHTTEKKLPAYRIYSVTKDGDKSIWFEIGAAWAHADGKGFNLQYGALPLPGAEIVLREPKQEGEGK